MGQLFTVPAEVSVAASATETILVLSTGTNNSVALRRIRVSQGTHSTSEPYLLGVNLCDGAGSGGSSVTPASNVQGGAACAASATYGPTTEPTYDSTVPLISHYWNSLVGYEWIADFDDRIEVTGNDHIGIYVTSPSGSTTATMRVELVFEEFG